MAAAAAEAAAEAEAVEAEAAEKMGMEAVEEPEAAEAEKMGMEVGTEVGMEVGMEMEVLLKLGETELCQTLASLERFWQSTPFEANPRRLDFQLLCMHRDHRVLLDLVCAQVDEEEQQQGRERRVHWPSLCTNPCAWEVLMHFPEKWRVADLCAMEDDRVAEYLRQRAVRDEDLDFDALSDNANDRVVEFLLARRPDRVNLRRFSENASVLAVEALIEWERRAGSTGAGVIDWRVFSRNACARALEFMARPENLHKIDPVELSGNPNPLALPLLLEHFPHAIDFRRLCRNSSDLAMDTLLGQQQRLDGSMLSLNTHPRAVAFLAANPEMIDYFHLSENASAVELLFDAAHVDKIHWNRFCGNASPEAHARLLSFWAIEEDAEDAEDAETKTEKKEKTEEKEKETKKTKKANPKRVEVVGGCGGGGGGGGGEPKKRGRPIDAEKALLRQMQVKRPRGRPRKASESGNHSKVLVRAEAEPEIGIGIVIESGIGSIEAEAEAETEAETEAGSGAEKAHFCKVPESGLVKPLLGLHRCGQNV